MGAKDGLAYDAPSAPSCKSNNLVAFYPSCSHTAAMPLCPSASSSGLPVPAALALCSILLPKHLQAIIIARMTKDSISPGLGCCFLVADTGATDHMFPIKLDFISYKSIPNLQVWMDNNSFLPVLGCGTAIISRYGQRILVCNALHVPGLAVPLYSLCAHLKQHSCRFLGTFEAGMLVYFPWFVLSVDTLSDCQLSYKPLDQAALLDTLHYMQPRCPPSLYPSEQPPLSCTVSHTPAFIEDDSSAHGSPMDISSNAAPLTSPTAVPLELPPSPTFVAALPHHDTLPINMSTLSSHLCSLANKVCPSSGPPIPPVPGPPSPAVPVLLSTMTQDKVLKLLHHSTSSPPAVCPCDTPNNSDTKTHWTLEEIHCTMGCQKYRNYRHILQVSRDGEWVNSGIFPPSLGSFATIPKAKYGQSLDRTQYLYLDAVQMDVAFDNCLAIGGFQYALILADRGTWYNWMFGLENLSSDCILLALCHCWAAAGSLAWCFYCDCDAKLFGTAISKYLANINSKIVAACAKHHSSNGLIESHWKVMVHMACTYLTE